MRICLISSNLHSVPTETYGAVEVQMAAHARGLARLGHEVDVLTVGDPAHRPPTEDEGVSYHLLGPAFAARREGGLRALLTSQLSFARAARERVRELQPDVAHWHSRYPCAVGLRGDTPPRSWATLYHAHNWKQAERMSYSLLSPRRLAAWGGARVDRAIAAGADHVIAVSEFMRERVLASTGLDTARVSVLTNVVDPLRFPVRSRAELDRAEPEILFVGRVAAEKGLATVIEAMPLVRRIVPGAVLTVVGPEHGGTERGGYGRGCRRRVSELGLDACVRFAGPLPNHELTARLRAARVVAVPSIWGEPCGVVVLEALASGVPVVASRVGGIPELIDDGTTGRLCPPGDVAAWAHALGSTLEDRALQERSLAAGPATIAERHTWDRVGLELVRTYERVLERRRAGAARPLGRDEPTAPDTRRRIKVLLVLTSSAGGAGEQAYQLARDLDRSAFDLTVAFGPGYPLDERFARLDLPIVHLSMSRRVSPFVNVRGMLQLRARMRREDYDLVATSCSIAGFHGRIAARLSGRKPVTLHIIQVYASRPHQNALRRAFYRRVERRLDRLTTAYVAVSRAVMRYGVDTGLMSAGKVEVIYNAAERSEVSAGARARVRAEFGIAEATQVVATLGRYEPQKGITHFLRAAALVREARGDVEFLVVGDGPLRAELEAEARALGIAEVVHFTGWRRDVPEVLGAVDVFALASLWETFGIVLAEAMLAELPIVASRVDGIPEVVADGETGFLVAPGDERALAERWLQLLGDPELAARMGRAGRARAEAQFSVPAMVRGYERCFRRLTGSAPDGTGE